MKQGPDQLPNRLDSTIRRDPMVGCMLGCGLMLFLPAGLLLTVSDVFYPANMQRKSQHWAETPCVIEVCRLVRSKKQRTTDPGDEYYLDLSYRYEFSGTEYSSDTVDFTLGKANSMTLEKEDIVRDYPPETRATCLVDPGKPSSAVLFPERSVRKPMSVLGPTLLTVGTLRAVLVSVELREAMVGNVSRSRRLTRSRIALGALNRYRS